MGRHNEVRAAAMARTGKIKSALYEKGKTWLITRSMKKRF